MNEDKNTSNENCSICYCGHDCSRCVTYLATVNDDDNLRLQAQKFYRDTLGFDIALQHIKCNGGRSDDIFISCRDCPWRKCCHKKNINSCSDCAEYPCGDLKEYMSRFVNKCNQIAQP